MARVIESSCCGTQTIASRIGMICPRCGGVIKEKRYSSSEEANKKK